MLNRFQGSFTKKTIFLLLTICVLSLLQAIPSWYQTPLRFYNPEHFWVGLAEGDTNEQALELAHIELTQQISDLVITDTDLSFLSKEAEYQAYFSEILTQNIQTFFEDYFQDVEIMNQEEYLGKFYIMVALNKNRFLRNLENEMDDIKSNIQSNLDRIEQLQIQGQIVFALDTYANILTSLTDLFSLKMVYDSLSPTPFTIQGILSGTELENRIHDLIASVRFEVVSGNQQTARVGTILPEAVVFNASSRRANGERINLSNLPVSIFYGDDKPLDNGFTNIEGNFRVYVLATPEQPDRGRIVIQINPLGYPDFYFQSMRHLNGVAHFRTTEALPLFINLTVIDETGQTMQNSHRQISRILTNNNIILQEEAPLFINGVVVIGEQRSVEGLGLPRYLADATVNLEFGITSTGAIIGTFQGTGRGLSENNEEDAVERAHNNISINTRELSQLITIAENQLSALIEEESRENLERGRRLHAAGNYNAAAEALLQVNFGENNIEEAMKLLRDMRGR